MDEDFLRDFRDNGFFSTYGAVIILLIFLTVIAIMVNLKIGNHSLLEMVIDYYINSKLNKNG